MGESVYGLWSDCFFKFFADVIAMKSASVMNENQTCPHCLRSNITLHELPEVTLLFLKNHSLLDNQMTKACKFCVEDFEKFRSSPTIYIDKLKAEFDERKKKWNDRVDVLKNAYRLFQTNKYLEAEPKYREYISTVEATFNSPLNNISAQMFASRGHPEELATFTLVLWDMVIICDQNNLSDTDQFATKFLELAKGSIAKSTLIHSIKKYTRKANNRKLFKQLLKDLRQGQGCFIASHVFENAYSPEVMALRAFRDQKLMPYFIGRKLVSLYYKLSPKLISVFPKRITQSTLSKKILRLFISLICD